MVQPELKWPMTPATPASTSSRATVGAFLSAASSSRTTSSMVLPRTPPFAFHSSTARRQPSLRS